MKRAIGFRVEPGLVNWALVEGTSEEPILVATAKIAAPATFDEPQALSFYRERVLLLLAQHSPGVVAVRYAETFGRRGVDQSDYRRCRIEGVILEASDSRGLKAVTGALASISKNLGTKAAKDYLKSDDLRGLEWSKYPAKNVREAILVAASALGK
ncbi:MAG: hypothetical protein ACLP6G_13655 [Terriglobales bacterium]